MNTVLINKKAVITGGTKGIGLAIAQSLLAEGADVVICGRNHQTVQSALNELSEPNHGRKVAGLAADVGKSEDVRHLFEFADKELGGIDILVNNAGSAVFRPAADLSVEEWDQMIATNLSGAFYCSKEALRRFPARNGGSIINISSLAGKNPMLGGSAYNASKFGMNGFSEAMMMDHRQENVRVSYVMPGSVDTEFNGHSKAEKSDWKIEPEDIAEIVIGILRMPARTLISRVEVRPSKPPKK